MVAADLVPSTALLEANRRLYELREREQGGKATAVRPERLVTTSHQLSPPGRQSSLATESQSLIAGLPDHLGWGSAAVKTSLETTVKQRNGARRTAESRDLAWGTEPPPISIIKPASTCRHTTGDTVKLYPDIVLGMLQKEQSAAGRIWLLLRYLDIEGQGWLRIDLIHKNLTSNDSKLHVCGRRHLRNLMQQGRGVFWKSDNDRVWLKSAGKVAAALGVERLTGRPVQLPLKALLGGIGQVRAHFYASFHSGRRSNNPISRAKLQQITHVPERTQRVYEQAAGVTSQRNIAVGRKYSKKEVQERAWRHGRATFKFVDKDGRQGLAGQLYVAWRLPNSYEGCHKFSPKGRQKKINQQIDLVNLGAQGNGLKPKADRLFHTNGLKAGKSYKRNGQDDIYWPAAAPRTVANSPQLWQVLPGRKEY